MKPKIAALALLAVSSAFSGTYPGRVIEVSRPQGACANYAVVTVQESNGTGTAKFRITKDAENYKDILAISLTALASGLPSVAEYNNDDNFCGTTFFLHGLTVKAQ